MLFLFESNWLPLVELFWSSETPGSGCFPCEFAGRQGEDREQALVILCGVQSQQREEERQTDSPSSALPHSADAPPHPPLQCVSPS